MLAPASLPAEELDKIVSKFKERLLNKKLKRELNHNRDLREIAETLNKEYFGGRLKISSIEYSTNQNTLFGYCNYRTGKILISHRLAIGYLMARGFQEEESDINGYLDNGQ